MLKALFEGILLGLTLAILLGPLFFAIIQASITNGFRSGIAIAIGIFLSDLSFIVLIYFGASSVLNDPVKSNFIGISGGFLLIIFGVFILFQGEKNEKKVIEIQKVNFPLLVIKGFFLNSLNPFTIFFWIGAVAIVTTKENFSTSHIIVFFSGTLGTVFITDVLKSYVALKIRNVLKPELLTKITRIAGLILILFGISLIYRVLS